MLSSGDPVPPVRGAVKAEPQVTEVGDADRTIACDKCYNVLMTDACEEFPSNMLSQAGKRASQGMVTGEG